MADLPKQHSNEDILAALGVDAVPLNKTVFSAKEERIIAGFEEIQRFVEEHGRAPTHGENNDIFERLYAARLDQIRTQEDCLNLVVASDYQGLLATVNAIAEPTPDYVNDEALLAELGVQQPSETDVTFLKHVKPRAEVNAAEEIASRTACNDFDTFKPLFERVQKELHDGARVAKLLTKNAKINQGDWFILFGQKIYVAEFSENRNHGFDGNDYRVRVIYDNGTESDLLMRSLQRVLGKDDAGRRIVPLSAGPLFNDIAADDDLASGTIYVLRSQSNHPTITANRHIIHKIGVTGGDVKKRIANAKLDPTYLMAEVDVVANYELYNISRTKLEQLIHKFFSEAKLAIEVNDRFGHLVAPQEWFLVPLTAIDDAVSKITDGTIADYYYDITNACLKRG